MKTIDTWFEQYGISHKNPTNIKIHKVCVPLITWSLLGMMWMIPTPSFMESIHLNWSYIFMVVAYAFYISLKSVKLVAVMTLLIAPMIALLEVYGQSHSKEILIACAVVFVLAWIGQFVGHKIEGKKPSFFEDLQFLLIGPGWCLNDLFKISKKS
ncbi:MAG: hypothetical protein CME69_06235 [Halobacteriovorax sp.]|nr:hypothetical protein [Halobacteriovorax sp.]